MPRSPRKGFSSAGMGQVGQRLVPAHVQRADDEPTRGTERPGDGGVDLCLLLLGGRRLAPQEQELGAQQAHALGAQLHRPGRLLGPSQVRSHLHGLPVPGHRRLASLLHQLPAALLRRSLLLPDLLHLFAGRIHAHHAPGSVQHHQRAVGHLCGAGIDGHHGRQVERARQDGDVGRGASQQGGKPEYPGAIQVRRVGGGEILGHQDAAHGNLQGPFLLAQHQAEHALAHVADVIRASRQQGIAQCRQPLGLGQVGPLPRKPGAGATVDGRPHGVGEIRIIQDLAMGREDGGLGGVRLRGEAPLQHLQLGSRLVQRVLERAPLPGRLPSPLDHLDIPPPQLEDGAHGKAGRSRDPPQHARLALPRWSRRCRSHHGLLRRRRRYRRSLAQSVPNRLRQRLHRLARIGTASAEGDGVALLDLQGHQAHHAAGVDAVRPAHQFNLAAEPTRQAHQHCRGPGVEAFRIGHHDRVRDHRVRCRGQPTRPLPRPSTPGAAPGPCLPSPRRWQAPGVPPGPRW